MNSQPTTADVLAAIPLELRQLKQWVCYRIELDDKGRETKIPYNPTLGVKASSTNPATWTSYETAVAMVARYSGIGFVFTQADPYTFIDFDNKANDPAIAELHKQIITDLDSYTEVSPSGKGYHVIVKGLLEQAAGRRGRNIEVYSALRFGTFTGNCILKPGVIEDRQTLINRLWDFINESREQSNASRAPKSNMTPETMAFIAQLSREPALETDEALFNRACAAENGDYFKALWHNDGWQSYINSSDTSQSVADQALINMLVFYTKNAEQVVRMFHLSALGQRAKAYRKDYLQRTLQKAYDREAPPVELVGMAEAMARLQVTTTAPALHLTQPDPADVLPTEPPEPSNPAQMADKADPLTLPPGLLGEMADFIYAQSPYPIREVALTSALAMFAGIAGRTYNVNRIGLNVYLLLLAETGIGKNAAHSGMSKLFNAIKHTCPTAHEFVGPTNIASAQALNRKFQETACFVSAMPEFGLIIQRLASARVSANDAQLQAALLQAYSSSGEGNQWGASAYADTAKNSLAVDAPALSILGEGTPVSFYESLTEQLIEGGLLSRFSILEYGGKRPFMNLQASHARPSDALLNRLTALTARVQMMQAQRQFCQVVIPETVQDKLNEFDRIITNYYNTSSNRITKILWSRSLAKVLKFAGLIAVSEYYSQLIDYNVPNWHESAGTPTLSEAGLQWALNFVIAEIQHMSRLFKQGEVGAHTEEVKQLAIVRRHIGAFILRPDAKMQPDDRPFRAASIIPYRAIQNGVANYPIFKKDRIGGKNALTRALTQLCESGYLVKLDAVYTKKTYGTSATLFGICDHNYFMEAAKKSNEGHY